MFDRQNIYWISTVASRYPDAFYLLAIFLTFFLTYCRIFGKDFLFVIDDEGVFKYSDQFIPETKDAAGKIVPEKIVTTYPCPFCEGDKKHEVRNTAFNPHLGFPGNIVRFLRLNIGKRFCVIGKNKKGHEVYGTKQSSRRHHTFSVIVHFLSLILGYYFLKPLIGQNLAFASCLLYSVHPLTTQTVAWISGVNYSLSMLFALAAIDASIYLHNPHVVIPLTVAFTFISGIILYIGCFTWLLLLFLGYKWAAFAAALIGMSILLRKGSETKNFRIKAFTDQNMAVSTKLNWRKPIVMIKTLWYYMRLLFLPMKMGLYHTWGYFYEAPVERIDSMFWAGILTLIGFIALFYYGTFPIRLGIIWYATFFILFSNFMTAQQFVADRYIVIPAFGICIIFAQFLYPTPFFWILLGLYAMRTFWHSFSFRNEVDFYMSNFMNFKKSEVALGNLGVAYMNQAMPGSAVDAWLMATKVNPHYDVSWYNLYSIFRANGRLQEALDFFRKVMDAKIVHFEDRWKKELMEFENNMKGTPVGTDIVEQANNQWRKYANG